jgi:hypothetical protein
MLRWQLENRMRLRVGSDLDKMDFCLAIMEESRCIYECLAGLSRI